MSEKASNDKISYLRLLIPVFTTLIILAFLDLINSLLIQPILLLLRDFKLLDVTNSNTSITITLSLNLILNVSALTVLYFIYFKKYKLLPNQKKNKVNGLFLTLKTYLAIFSIIYLIGIIFLVIQSQFFPNEPLSTPYDTIFPSDLSYSFLNFLLLTLLVVIMAPILEEFIFRRLLIPLFEGTEKISTTMAVILSSTMFGLIHTEADIINGSVSFAIIHFTTAFMLGLGLGGVYIITRDVKYPIIYHAVNNGFALTIQFLNILSPIDQNNMEEISSPLIYLGILVLVMLLLGVLFIILTLASLKKFKHNFTSQFKGKLTKKQNFSIIGLIIVAQGFLFVVLPYFEFLILESQNWDSIQLIIINLIVPIFVFTFILIFILSKKEYVNTITKVTNEPLTKFIDHRYQEYPTPVEYRPEISTVSEPIKNQKFCQSCGHTLPQVQEIQFCPTCGFNLKDI